MPNIEIHGYYSHHLEAMDLKEQIFNLFKSKPYIDEMVVTFCQDEVFGRGGKEQPFIRLVNSCQEHTEEILEMLGTLGIDIEHAKLEAFYPKGKIP